MLQVYSAQNWCLQHKEDVSLSQHTNGLTRSPAPPFSSAAAAGALQGTLHPLINQEGHRVGWHRAQEAGQEAAPERTPALGTVQP